MSIKALFHRYVEVEALLLHKKEVLSMWKKEQDKDKPEPSAVISEVIYLQFSHIALC